MNVGNSFSGPPNPLLSRSNKFQNSSVEDNDDDVFIEPVQPPNLLHEWQLIKEP